ALPDNPRCSLIRQPTSQGWVAALSLPSRATREFFSYRTLPVTTLLLFSTTPPALTYWRAPVSSTATSLRLQLRLRLRLLLRQHLRLQLLLHSRQQLRRHLPLQLRQRLLQLPRLRLRLRLRHQQLRLGLRIVRSRRQERLVTSSRMARPRPLPV